MKIIDLFAGVGGMSQGFIRAGVEVALAIEHDKEIAYAFQHNHPGTIVIAENIQAVSAESVFDKLGFVNGIIGGPPCQGFSQKGQRKSILDERNFLFKSYTHFVEVFRPTFFVMENVPNVVTTANGYFRKEIIETFENMGYRVSFKILNAANFGVPQLRRRAFFIGTLNGRAIEFPDTNGQRTNVREAIYDLPFIASGEGETFYN